MVIVCPEFSQIKIVPPNCATCSLVTGYRTTEIQVNNIRSIYAHWRQFCVTLFVFSLLNCTNKNQQHLRFFLLHNHCDFNDDTAVFSFRVFFFFF